MKRSESLTNLAGALAKAQGEFEAATKDHVAKVLSKKGDGSSYSYSYADLASVLDVIRAPLSKNGLSFIQLPTVIDGRASVSVTTTLFHESGEFIESDPLVLPVSADMTGAQAIGSAITFARRYSLSAILAIATEADDDGNEASGQKAETGKKEPLPDCPKCKSNKSTIIGKAEFGGGFVCFKKKNDGCGHTWQAPGADPQSVKDQARQAASGEESQVPPKEKPPVNKPLEALKTRLHVIGCQNKEEANAVVRFITGADNGVYKWPTLDAVAADPGAPAAILLKIAESSQVFADDVIYHDALSAAGMLEASK